MDIVVGSHFKEHALQAGADEVVIFETAEAALQHHSPRVRVIHMELDEAARLPAHVPSRSTESAGRDGAALDSSHSLRIGLSKYREYRSIVEEKIGGADVVRLYVSSGGGTGTGMEAVIRKILREAQFAGRIIALHHYDPTVRRAKMTKSLKGLLFEESEGNDILDVLVRRGEHIPEMLGTEGVVWAEIEALVANMHAAESYTDLDLRQVRCLRVEHEAFIEDIVFDVVTGSAPDRLEAGDPRLGTGEQRLQRRAVEQELEQIARLTDPLPLDEVRGLEAAAKQGYDAVMEAAEQLIQDFFEEDREQIEACLGRLRESLLHVGRKRFDIESRLIEPAREQIKEEDNWLARLDLRGAVTAFVQSQTAWFPSGLWGTSEDGETDPAEEVREYVVSRHCHMVNTYLARRVAEVLLPSSTAFQKGFEEPQAERFRLPQPSGFRQQLLDAYFGAESHRNGVEDVRDRVREHLPALINEVLAPRLHRDLAPGFDTRHSERGRGLVVTSPFVGKLDLRGLHLNPSHVAPVLRPEADATTFYHFKVTKRIADLPALRDMVRLVEERSAESEDRRPYLRTAAEVWPLPLFEEPGAAGPETAALLLAKAYFTHEALRVEKDGIRVRSVDGAGHFTDFGRFCAQLTPRQAHRLHRGFWNEAFAEQRGECARRIEQVIGGEVPSGRKQRRYERMKDFVGATAWKSAMAELHRRVQIAGSDKYWA